MKVGGIQATKEQALYGPLCFKRMQGEKEVFLTFYARPVWDFDEFRALVPKPENSYGAYVKGGWQTDDNHPAYLDELNQYVKLRSWYITLKSLEPSQIEWEKVRPNDPKTWKHIDDEISGLLSVFEAIELRNLVNEANALDDSKLEENRQTFFRQREAEKAATEKNEELPSQSSSQSSEAGSSSSGEPANASA